MIEIVRDQVVYNAGSHLDVDCVYRNTTGSKKDDGGTLAKGAASSFFRPREVEEDVPEGTITWLHNGGTFSHRNRRRFVFQNYNTKIAVDKSLSMS
jgi:hypothetical protein